MAALVDAVYEPFHTPSLLDASISADGNTIDSYFNDKMDVEKSSCFDQEAWALFPQQNENEEASDFDVNGEGFAYPSIATPPPSAKEAPSSWAFNPVKTGNTFFANPLHQIDTTQSSNTRFDWGQPTPPDDQGSPSSQFPAVAEEAIKQEEEADDVQESKPTPTRRKKSVEQVEGQPKRRRPRKSMSAGSTSTDAPADPVEEERRNRFLERNRVAASKCRQKKKEWTQNLENHARDLHSNNHQLQVLVNSLKDEVMYLRNEMLKHGSCDCTGIRDYLAREADMLASGTSPRTPGSQHRSSVASAASSPRHSMSSLSSESHQNLDPSLQN